VLSPSISADTEASGWILELNVTIGRSVAEDNVSDKITDPVSVTGLVDMYWMRVGVSFRTPELVSTLAVSLSSKSNAVVTDGGNSERVLDARVVATGSVALSVVASLTSAVDKAATDGMTELKGMIGRSVLI
jgi:hypothetical protein